MRHFIWELVAEASAVFNEAVHVNNQRLEAMASVVAGPSEPSVVHDGSIEREIDPEEVRC